MTGIIGHSHSMDRQRYSRRTIGLAVAAITFILLIRSTASRGETKTYFTNITPDAFRLSRNWQYDPARDAGNHGLDEEQCAAAFPGLYRPIEEWAAMLPAPLKLEDTIPKSKWVQARAMIYDNELYVIRADSDKLVDNRKYATLNAIMRAITAVASTGRRFPNIEFELAFGDISADGKRPNWAYDRKIGDVLTLMMPDFAYYSWPSHGIGTYRQVQQKIRAVEEGLSFQDKIPKLVWRGSMGFGGEIRHALVNQSEGHGWSDVQGLQWLAKDYKDKMLTMEDHCKYQFVAQTEGLTYSGRLKYLHSCESVIIAHEFAFETHDQHLMIPHGPEQNYVQVRRDFSDLPSKMDWLLAHPADAARIARKNVEVFRDRYLSAAAEGCYWRRLIDEWGRMSAFEPAFFEEVNGTVGWRGVPAESYGLTHQLAWNEQSSG